MDGFYTCGLDGYSVISMDAPSRYHGIVAVFYWESPRFEMEAIQQFGSNVGSFHLATGERRWYIIICYLSPNKY